MVTIDDIRKLIDAGQIAPVQDKVILEGTLANISNQKEPYKIYHGLDIIRANTCDKLWGTFNLRLIEFIKSQNYSPEALANLSSTIQLDDSHWDWLAKTCIHNNDEYEWFFLDINGQPQAACLIYHPKKSSIDSGEIFYIEYVAVAPWNRNNPMEKKYYHGAGSEIIKCAMKYATETLGLRFGFSLHSLPKAAGFYEKIGMINYCINNKESLNYYEMPEDIAKKYMEA
ncbi:GNAT family N-acetyltransferase [Pseudoalteromonas sp. Z9A5]|jgi:hypothetical protein|uniref:GNAT family N-acetyltransferase n=1 Tax=Pseudoalteromonas sp. Z9A5 TaxID=2686355 RepID=UPI00140D12B7|nr:GNAT family N-acetyltransferase [Pseudoalteromonas sp. Z9A5]